MSLQLNRPISRGHHGTSSTAAISRVRTAQVQRSPLLVRLAFLLFLALLVEGIARKWVFPGQHEYFYFLRDPLLLGFYLLAWTQGAIQPKGWFALWLGAAVFISLFPSRLCVERHFACAVDTWACAATSCTCRSPSLLREPLNVTTLSGSPGL